MQTLFNGFRSLVLVLSIVVFAAAGANTERYIAECRNDSIDRQSYRQCMQLQYQAAELALSNAEKAWTEELLKFASEPELQIPASPPETSAEKTDVSATPDKINPPDAPSGTGLISIVGNSTLSEAGAGSVINVDDSAADAGLVAALAGEQLRRAAQNEQFEMVSATFRKFRDEQCDWEAELVDSAQDEIFVQACKTARTYERVRLLRKQLAEKITTDNIGQAFRGFYLETGSGASFQDCDRRQTWQIDGDAVALQAIATRYSQITGGSPELLYLEVRGRKSPQVEPGTASQDTAVLEVRSVVQLRPILARDCSATLVTNEEPVNSEGGDASDQAEFIENASELEIEELVELALPPEDRSSILAGGQNVDKIAGQTIDDLAESGLLYGYFQNWVSACAVEQTRVCRTQTEAQFATTGDWNLVVDRSSRDEWILTLQSGDPDVVDGGRLRLVIDDSEIRTQSVQLNESQSGILIAGGTRALELLKRMRRGREIRFDWTGADSAVASFRFSLLGITSALSYFELAGL